MQDVDSMEPQPERIENTEAQLRQEREELRRIINLIPQTIVVLNPTARPFTQIAWHLSTRGCLWTKCAPITSGIACSIQKTFRDSAKSARKVSPARFRSKTSNGLAGKTANIGGFSSGTTHC